VRREVRLQPGESKMGLSWRSKKRLRQRVLRAGLILLVGGVGCHAGASQKDWAARLSSRRAVLELRRVAGSPAGYVEFFPGGECLRGGADISIFDEKGEPVPHRIMSVGPGERFLIAYKLTDSDKYFLYYGQPTPAGRASSWGPQCGVFLRTYRRPRGSSNTVREIEAMARSVRSLFGGGYRAAIFDGYNPYGGSDDYVSIYTAYLNIPGPGGGTYFFATNSDDSSALYVDGRLVAAYPGIHRARARKGERNGSLELNKGVHLLTYYHVEYTGPQATTAAWKQPGDKFFTPIPAEAFVAVSPSTITAVEDKRGRLLDFSFAIEEIYAPEGASPLIGVKFSPFSLNTGKGCYFLWDFGDGERSNEESPTHVYLSERVVPVSLTVLDEEKKRHTASHYVSVLHLEGRNTTSPRKTRESFEKILRGYTLRRLSPDELESLHDFYASGEGNEAQVSSIASMLLKAIASSEAERRAKFLLSWARAKKDDTARNTQLHRARARFYQEAAKITRVKLTRAEALLELGDVYFHSLNDNNAALNCYGAVVNENADEKLTRRAVIGQGDVYLSSGDLAEAEKFYNKAGILPEDAKGAEALRTSYGNLIEGYIKQKDFKAALDAIDTWERKYPGVKTSGYSLILTSRIAFARGDMAEVRKLATCIVETLDEDSFKPEAYYLLISALLRQRQPAVAKKYYEALKEGFPRDRHVDLLRRFFP